MRVEELIVDVILDLYEFVSLQSCESTGARRDRYAVQRSKGANEKIVDRHRLFMGVRYAFMFVGTCTDAMLSFLEFLLEHNTNYAMQL